MESSNNNLIYLIDDDEVFNFIHTRVIFNAGYHHQIESYTSASKALEKLQQLSNDSKKDFPSYIFLDINMPSMDGWEFLNDFENLPSHVKDFSNIFILSSSIDPLDIEKSREYKVVKKFLTKPLTSEILNELSLNN